MYGLVIVHEPLQLAVHFPVQVAEAGCAVQLALHSVEQVALQEAVQSV